MLKHVLIGLVASVTSIANADAETLNLLTWEKYMSPRVVEAWTRETGIELNQIYFDSGEDRDRILADGNTEIDLAVMNENTTKIFSRKGLVVAVSPESVPSSVNAVPRWLERCSGYGLPYFWGTLGIVYRADKMQVAPTSWADLLSPSPELAGHIAMMTGFDDLLTPSLILNGKSINTQDEADLKIAFATLKKQSPSVRTYDYIITSAQDSKIGSDLHMALAYSGDQTALSTDGHDWRYVVPKEGSVLWVDCMGVLTASKKRADALRFLDFLNRPDISAMNATDLALPTANAAALPLLPAAFRDNAQVFPPQSVIDASGFYEENGAQTVQLRKRIANSLINFHDAH